MIDYSIHHRISLMICDTYTMLLPKEIEEKT